MPPSAGTLRVGRYFAALFVLLAVLYAIVFWPGQAKTPKLGLDLEGGKQVTLQATANGKVPSKASLQLAQQIITDRVNGLGVAAAQVQVEGTDRIVVSVPGKNNKSLDSVGKAFQLQLRPLMIDAISAAPAATTTPTASASAKASATGSASAKASTSGTAKATTSASSVLKPSTTATPSPAGRVVPHAAGSATPSASTSPSAATSSGASSSSSPSASSAASPSASGSGTAAPAATTQIVDVWAPYRKQFKTDPPKDAAAYNALDATHQQFLQAMLQAWQCNPNIYPKDDINQPLITCDQAGAAKYLLGAVIVQGTEIDSAQAVTDSTSGAWTVSVTFKSSGQKKWALYTSQHNVNNGAVASTPADVVADTLDSFVYQTSTIQSTINGATQISGNFTAAQAQSLANALKYGALPLNFTTLTNTDISPTLGTDQLKAGLLAGGIGLLLVVLYSLFYYRALGLVTIASLVVSGGLTYAMLVILGHQIDFTLTLAGIAGFIVAVGITADSFVVFFERIKDEVHEGRSPRVAIPRAWDRARRTILSADFVSFLAAVILYYFAAGDVRGFAFTLGLSTVLDLIVVFLFTHPIVSLFSRSAAFGSARFTGLNHVRGIPSYRATPARSRKPVRVGGGGGAAGPAAGADPEIDGGDEAAATDLASDARVETFTPVATPAGGGLDDTSVSGADEAAAPSTRVSKPAGGTAAERAAARRAAQRAASEKNGDQ